MSSDLVGLVNQLRSTLGKMEVALGAIADAIVWTGKDGRVQWCNAAFDRLVGQPHISVLDAHLSDLLPLIQNGKPVAAKAYPNLKILQGKYKATEYEVWQNRDRLILDISGNRVELTDQEQVAVLVIRDVTAAKRLEAQRQQTEATLRESEMKFRSIVENANDMIALIDTTGTIVYISSNLQPIAGYAPSELEGESFLPFIHPDDHLHCIEAFQRVATTGERQSGLEYRAKIKNGGWQWQVTNLASLQDANGNLLVISIARDLTERKQAEESLRRSNAILKAQQEASIDGILVVDEVREVVSYNQRFCQLWNIPDSVIAADSDQSLLSWVINQLEQPQEFLEKVEYLYTHPEETSRDEISLRDGRTLDRYSAAVRSQSGDYYGRIWYFRDISERVQAEIELKRSADALRLSEARLRSFVEANVIGILFSDIYGRISQANDEFLRIVGYTHEDLATRRLRWADLTPTEYLSLEEERLAEARERGACTPYEKEYIRKDGSRVPVLVGYSLVGDAREQSVAFILDLTERKKIEAALRQSEQEFRALVENVPDVIIRFDRDSHYLYINSRVERETGVPPSAFIGKTPREMGFPDAIAVYWQTILDEVFATAQETEVEFELPLFGKHTYQSLRVVPEFNQHGEVESVLTIWHDLTYRKRSEEAINRRAQLDNLLSSISRQFIDQEIDTAINFALRELAQFLATERSRMFVYSETQRLSYMTHEWCTDGISPLAGARIVPEDDAPWLYSHVLYNAKPLVVSQLSDLPPEADDEKVGLESLLIQSIAIVPMMHMGKVVGFIGTDTVSYSKIWGREEINLIQLVGELIAIGQSRHAAEEALRLAKDAAEAANRAKSTFLANMSHELRTPLNAILGFAQLMERSDDLTSRQRDFLATINRSGEHLLTLINDVLEMSKIEAGRVTLNSTPCDLYRFLQAIEDMVQVRADAKALSFQVELAVNLPQYILIDEGKLRQVLINLLNNAIKFTDAGGVRLRARVITDKLYFEIQDTGRGIAAEELGHLFQPFVQTTSGKQLQEGTGLGLTISRQFVQLMGGDIQVNSTVGLGSTFSFEIPVVLTDPFESALSVAPRRVLKLAPNQPLYRLLVVDDRPENNELLTQLLQGVGFEVHSAVNGQDAITQWQTWRPHLIWMDMRMPVMDGYEATQQIRSMESQQRLSPRLKIIALTASAFEEQRSRILAVGCDDMVRKPFREQVIFDKLMEHLGVQYLYAESRTEDRKTGETENTAVNPTSLQIMPVEWIAALHQAAIEVDAELISELIQQIPEEHADLASGLAELRDRFCFDEILELTQMLLTD